MGGITGRVLFVHDIIIRFIIILIIYIYRTQPIGTDLLGGGAIGPDIRVRDMISDATYEEGVGQTPPQGGLQADGMATAEGLVRRLGLPCYGGYDGGSEVAGMETSVSGHQNTVVKYIATRPIMDLCL